MNAVGIDVSKGKSTVAVLQPFGVVVASPHDVPHTGSSLKELAAFIKKLPGETRVVMEATGNYYEPIARFLHEQGIFVSVVNPMLISDFGGNTLRKPKTDKKDSIKIASYALTYWLDLKQYKPQEDLRKSLKMLNRQYHQAVKVQTMLNNNLISLLDLTFPGINKLFSSHERDADGHLKWVDFVLKFPHRDKVAKLTPSAFKKKYQQWCKDNNSYYQKTGNLIESLDNWQIDDIPNSWNICCLGEICDYGNCINIDTKDIPENAWILDLEDIEKDTGRVIQKLTKKERNSTSTKHLFHRGQVLYSKLRPYLNKVVLADDDGYCTSEILPLDFENIIIPNYARYFIMSPTFLRYANHCSYGVKMPRLGTLDGKKAVFTVPPVNEQKRIADKIDQLFSILDTILSSLD